MYIENILADVHEAVTPLIGHGTVADYIPGLASVNPNQFGMAVAMNNGAVYGVGDWRVPFSTQSITKVFALVLELARDGEKIWQRVGREPSGSGFHSMAELEKSKGIPRNPFVNSGALVVTDALLSVTDGDPDAVLNFLRAENSDPDIHVDEDVAASEALHGDRNAAIAHLLASYGNLVHPVQDVLTAYFRQCAIAMDCRDLAAAGAFLARAGLRSDGSRMLTASQNKRVNSVMLTSGMYDAAGDFAFQVGLPGKSGVGGGILAVVPGRCTVCVWSPGLNASGNSLVGVRALDEFTTRTGWSVF